MNYQQILNEIFKELKSGDNLGYVASYIPELAKINPENLHSE